MSGDVKALSPKTGVRCYLSDALQVRLSALRAVKPALVTNQTIEPTQVAGFNQFYDDFNGTKAWIFGIGLDSRVSDSLYAGADFIYRELDALVEFPVSRKEFSLDADEKSTRAYVYWAPLDHWAVISGVTFNVIDFENFSPDRVKTVTVPTSVNYFHASGLFASAGPTYVWQDVQPQNGGPREGKSNLFLIDAAIGYRLPKRYGIASLSFLNMTNERFKYQDNDFRTPTDSPAISPFIPERTILGRLTLSF